MPSKIDADGVGLALNGTALLVVVTGPPCSGKTTLATRIAEEFRLPLIAKDAIKESLFDTMGSSDREWSKKLGYASLILLFDLIEAQLRAGKSVVAENAFHSKLDGPRFEALRKDHAFELVQVYCFAERDVLLARLAARAESGQRHPGHVEQTDAAHVERGLSDGTWDPMEVGGELTRVDTTDFDRVDHRALIATIGARSDVSS